MEIQSPALLLELQVNAQQEVWKVNHDSEQSENVLRGGRAAEIRMPHTGKVKIQRGELDFVVWAGDQQRSDSCTMMLFPCFRCFPAKLHCEAWPESPVFVENGALQARATRHQISELR
jgi:hypothetical protein